ncbi:nucleoside-diphosphate-sugar epimerase [Melghirimyces profundicolus]|uniref:Nucleoside-diphosphate-sugar epimerase n=1 Tax=Melghirimyces profundicolus TaxID=1242148 RepID=A0A2T6BW73_9BACL|nr:NAD-dependent epimerase/dehydratase family protein [Melghirimyces profundicolus]PTX60334.1 nucleoside-diphosphate-sugar epimerase [Melghirimyces profundicolus]
MILVTGADGYMGWPLMLRLGKKYPEERIVGVDHMGRRKWVKEIGSVSAIGIRPMEERIQAATECGMTNLSYIQADLTDRRAVDRILSIFRPRIILHLAAQPSAPYSHINGQSADYTQENNNRMCRNLLWALKELDLSHTHFIETTTTGVYGAPEFKIPEGYLTVKTDTGRDTVPYPGMAGSWYHMSKANDVNNLYLSSRLWGLTVTDMRTAIVFGTDTTETRLDPRLQTRFDFDYYFGVVANRFCAQALAGSPITVYGKGEQKKPMISLEDAVQSLANAVDLPLHGEFRVYNQMTVLVSPRDIAYSIRSSGKKLGMDIRIEHLPNPRKENETHAMQMENRKFLEDLLSRSSQTLEEGIDEMMRRLHPVRRVFQQYRDRFMGK